MLIYNNKSVKKSGLIYLNWGEERIKRRSGNTKGKGERKRGGEWEKEMRKGRGKKKGRGKEMDWRGVIKKEEVGRRWGEGYF